MIVDNNFNNYECWAYRVLYCQLYVLSCGKCEEFPKYKKIKKNLIHF